MRFKQKIVKLSLIDSNDDSFRITTQINIDYLMDSIDNVGVLNLPLLIEKNSGYKIVCGFRRIEACRRLGWTDVEVRILDSDTKRLECIKYAISDNSLQMTLNLIAQSISINMIFGFFKDVSVLGKSLSVMGLPDNLFPDLFKAAFFQIQFLWPWLWNSEGCN
jgi:ParB family chromosome partitioning protein